MFFPSVPFLTLVSFHSSFSLWFYVLCLYYSSVSDGEYTTPELDFAILLLSNHQQPPVFQVLDPLLEVNMGGQATIGKSRIQIHSTNA